MELSKKNVMAVATGLVFANLYYCQYINPDEFKIPHADAGTIAYLASAGYAMETIFMVPLGDKIEKHKFSTLLFLLP
jgi:hypothetical protein